MTDTITNTSASNSLTADLGFEPEPISPYDPRDASSKRAFVLLAVTFGGLLALALLVFNLYQPGTRDRDSAPILAEDDTPYKVQPVDAGGEAAPDQDREVFATIDGEGTPDVNVAPAAERPGTLPAMELPDRVPVEVEPVVPATQPATPVEEPKATIPAPTPSAPVSTTPRPSTSTTVSGGSSPWVVQVASLRSRAEAERTGASITSRFESSLPGSARVDIQTADLAEKGIYYRVRIAGLADKAAANRLCQTFTSGNQACYVTR